MKFNMASSTYTHLRKREIIRDVIIFILALGILAFLLFEIRQPFPVRILFQPQIQDIRSSVHEEYVEMYYPLYYFSSQLSPIFSIIGDNPNVYRSLIDGFFPKHPFIVEANIKVKDKLYTIEKIEESTNYIINESLFDNDELGSIAENLSNTEREKISVSSYFIEDGNLFIRLLYIANDDVLFYYVVKFDIPKLNEDDNNIEMYAYVINNDSVIAFPVTDLTKPVPKNYLDVITTVVKESMDPRGMNRVDYGDEHYWVYKGFFSIDGAINEIGVVVAEENLYNDVRPPLMIILILFMIMVLLLAIFLAFRYVRILDIYKNTNDIKALIERGENTHLEFKATLRYDIVNEKVNKDLEAVIMKSIAAFNNTEGGRLIIGIKNCGEIVGLESDYSTLKNPNRDFFELHLRTLVETNYGNAFSSSGIRVFFIVEDDKEICNVNIGRGREPLYTKITNKQGATEEKFYIRVGNSSREITYASEIASYVKKHFK